MKTISQIKVKAKRSKKFLAAHTELVFDMRAARTAAGLSLRDVVKEAGVSCATIGRVELGATPDLATAIRLAAFYEKQIPQIWKLRGNGER